MLPGAALVLRCGLRGLSDVSVCCCYLSYRSVRVSQVIIALRKESVVSTTTRKDSDKQKYFAVLHVRYVL